MADNTVATSALSIGFEEAVAELPPSPTEEWGKPFTIARGDRLNIPIVEPVRYAGMSGGMASAMTQLSLKMPLDTHDITALDDTALAAAHRFLHMVDILAWSNGQMSWVHEYSIQHVAWLLSVRYRDPFFGELQWTQMVHEESLTDYHHRRYIIGQCVDMIQREREIKAAEVMSTIDREVMARGLHQDIDYWRPTR